MNYTIKKRTGEEITLTSVQLFAAYNNGEVEAAWPAKTVGGSAWARVGDILGVLPPDGVGESSTDDSTEVTILTAKSVINRYGNAYLVGETAGKIGSSVQVIGAGIGGIIFVAALVSAFTAQAQSDVTARLLTLLAGGVGAVAFVVPFWVMGVMVKALGELLKATLDTAVHTSPFLQKDEQAEVMSL